MAALRAGKMPDTPNGPAPNLAGGISSDQAFLEFLAAGAGGAAAGMNSKERVDAIPGQSLDEFKRGTENYFNSLRDFHEREEHIDQLLRKINPQRKARRNSLGSYWGSYGLPGGQQTNLTSWEPMNANLQFAPLTLMWLTLMYAYTTYGIIQRAIDVPVYDAFRGGLDIESNEMEADDIDAVQEAIQEQGVLESLRDGNIWARLFGGGALIFNSDGEDYSKPLNMETFGINGGGVEIYDASRWELGSESRIPLSGFYDFYGLKVHSSRVMTLCGKRAPFLIRDQLAGWGLSDIQRMSEDFNGYMRTKNAKFELMLEAKIDVFKIKGYKSQLASPNASQLTKNRIALINQSKSYSNAMIMDEEDDYVQKQVGFAGIAEMAKENRMDIAEALQMPQSKIWGIGSTGLSSGEDDLETYNSSVESNIREPNGPRVRRVLKMVVRSVHGTDLKFKFKWKPLRVLSSEAEEAIKKSKTDRILANLTAQIITPRQALEWQQKEGLIPIAIQTDAQFVDLPGNPMSPEDSAAEELRAPDEATAAHGDDPSVARKPTASGAPAAAPAARGSMGPRAPKTDTEGTAGGSVRGYEKIGTEPPPVGFAGGGDPGDRRVGRDPKDPRGWSGAGGGSAAIPWPEPSRQLDGANIVRGPGKTPPHPERTEQAGRGGEEDA